MFLSHIVIQLLPVLVETPFIMFSVDFNVSFLRSYTLSYIIGSRALSFSGP